MVHYAVFFTLFLAAVALAQDDSRHGHKPSIIIVTKTITVTKTPETDIVSPKPGKPTSVPSSGVEPTSTSEPLPGLSLGLSSLSVVSTVSRISFISPNSSTSSSTPSPSSPTISASSPTLSPSSPTLSPSSPTLSPSSPTLSPSSPTLSPSSPTLSPSSPTHSPSSPAPSPTSTSGPPEGDGDDEDCGDDEEGDNTSSILPVNTSVKPNSSSSSYSPSFSIPPKTLIELPSSSISPPIPSSTESSSSEPAPVPSDSMLSSPASSVISSTGAPKPTSTGKYDRDAICGNQKREPSPLEAAPKLSKRVLRRRIVY